MDEKNEANIELNITKNDQNISEEKQKNETRKNKKIGNIIKTKKRSIFVLASIIIAAIVIYITFRGSYLEMLEIGEKYVNVFWQNVRYMSITLVVNFIIIFILFYLTNRHIKKGLKDFFDKENKKMPKLINKSISFIIAIIVSSIISNFIVEKVMLFINSTQFGKIDSIFGLDIGYFMFQKPFIEMSLWYVLIATAAVLIYSVIYYIICFNLFFDGVDRNTLKNSKIVKQLIRIIMIFVIVLSTLILLKTQDIGTEKFISLQDETSSYYLYGAGFIDVNLKLWGYRILSIVIITSVYIAAKAFVQGKTKKTFLAILIVPIYLVCLSLILVVTQLAYVSPNELDIEQEYISENINNTKDAYGINISEVILENPKLNIESADITLNQNIINNILIISSDNVLKDLNSSQNAKGYYIYNNTQIGKYYVDGKETLVYVSPREIASGNATYNNKTYEYTHGYSVVLTSASSLNENGTLNHIQKDFDTTSEEITITEPRLYFGTQTNDTVVINTKGKAEFDYPIFTENTVENEEYRYNGDAGLELNFIDRLILAIKEKDLKLATSSNITANSKILTNRNIIKRAKTIMPYLLYDENPYLVINDEGKLIWVLDAYTTSNAYPYSQMTILQQNPTTKLELNYIRNSVKVLIDAYNGTVQFYITDRNDPIAMAYYNIYPDLFMDKDEQIPADIAEHFVYPEFLYNIQAKILTRYHNIDSSTLYRQEDIWEVATHNIGKTNTKTGIDIQPYYAMIKTGNNEKLELSLLLPFTPYGKQNLISYLSAGYNSSGESNITIYRYSKNSNILGPMQLDTQIEQDSIISKQLESLNINGTKIIKNMIIVPLNNSILYVEPIYQQYLNEKDMESNTQTLKKVIVASGSKVAIGDNLKQALSNLVSRYAVDIEIEDTDNIEDLINLIIKANNNLNNSNNSNNWEMIGKDIEKLQELINKLQAIVEEQKKSNIEDENKDKDTERTNNNSVLNNVVDARVNN